MIGIFRRASILQTPVCKKGQNCLLPPGRLCWKPTPSQKKVAWKEFALKKRLTFKGTACLSPWMRINDSLPHITDTGYAWSLFHAATYPLGISLSCSLCQEPLNKGYLLILLLLLLLCRPRQLFISKPAEIQHTNYKLMHYSFHEFDCIPVINHPDYQWIPMRKENQNCYLLLSTRIPLRQKPLSPLHTAELS